VQLSVQYQLVQASVAGLVVAVAVPPVATTPVNDGIEKYVAAHAAGAAVVIDASFVKVTVSEPLAATVSGVVNVWTLPEVVDE
jgi:putative effector of murein hydrolase